MFSARGQAGRAVAVCAAEGTAMQAAASCTLVFLYISFLYMSKHLPRHRWGCVFSTSTQTIRLLSLSCLLSWAGPKLSNTDSFFSVSRSNLAQLEEAIVCLGVREVKQTLVTSAEASVWLELG